MRVYCVLDNRERNCGSESFDFFRIVKRQIGKQTNETIAMSRAGIRLSSLDGKEPATPSSYIKQDKCIWEYNILGLWSIGECLSDVDDCSDAGNCMRYLRCCADHSDWSDCIHSEAP